MKNKETFSIQIVCFQGKISEWISSIIYKTFFKKKISTHRSTFEDTIASGFYDHTFFIFPILGENRLPENVEMYLKKINKKNFQNCHIVMSCDIDPKFSCHYEVAFEFMKRFGEKSFSPPLIIDNPPNYNQEYISSWALKIMNYPIEKGHGITFKKNKSIRSSTSPLIAKLEPYKEWKTICDLLKKKPLISEAVFSKDHISLSFITQKPYPKSLLKNLSHEKLEMFWYNLNKLTAVTELSLPYAELKSWPKSTDNLLGRLESLNITTNAFEHFDFLEKCPRLMSLNVSASGLKNLPAEICHLKQIKILFAYKNFISELPFYLTTLKNLYRLSLYRNRLKEIPAWVKKIPSLTHLNIGGNPIEYLPDELSNFSLEYLGIRNCGLLKIPDVINKMNLKSLDLSKNPLIKPVPVNLKTILEC